MTPELKRALNFASIEEYSARLEEIEKLASDAMCLLDDIDDSSPCDNVAIASSAGSRALSKIAEISTGKRLHQP